MATLDQRRLDAVLGAVRRCSAAPDVAAFQREAIAGMRAVVDCDSVSYNEIRMDGQPAVSIMDPSDIIFEGAHEILAEFALQNPLIAHYARTSDPKALMISDFLSLDELRATDLYNLLYRRMGVDRQLAMALPSSAAIVVGITVNRSGHDFTEEDRLALDLLRPHLTESFAHVVSVAGLTEVLEALDAGVVIVDPADRIAHATPSAQAALRRWFVRNGAGPGRLPEALHRWLDGHRQATSKPVLGEPPGDYTDRRDATTLTVQRLSTVGGHEVLRLVERRDNLTHADLRRLGLTPRQSDVLLALAKGLTNAEIARQLGTQPATVRKHIEHVFSRLGVTNRTEAVAAAYREATRYR